MFQIGDKVRSHTLFSEPCEWEGEIISHKEHEYEIKLLHTDKHQDEIGFIFKRKAEDIELVNEYIPKVGDIVRVHTLQTSCKYKYEGMILKVSRLYGDNGLCYTTDDNNNNIEWIWYPYELELIRRTEDKNPLTIQSQKIEEELPMSLTTGMEPKKVAKKEKKVTPKPHVSTNLSKAIWCNQDEPLGQKTFNVVDIYSDGDKTTVVKWGDGTETKINRMEGTLYTKYDAFVAALAKRVYGCSSFVRKIAEAKTTITKKRVKTKKPEETPAEETPATIFTADAPAKATKRGPGRPKKAKEVSPEAAQASVDK